MTSTLARDRKAPVRLKLVVASGPDFGKVLELERGTVRVGKEPGVELELSDPTVSRTHLMVEVLPYGVRVVDNRSRNGSFFQGVRFESLELEPPAVIQVGRTSLKLLHATDELGLPPSDKEAFGFLIGRSLAMRQLFTQLERVAPGSSDVLLEGETGTGKELCARSLHAQSPRARGPYVVLDVSAVPKGRFEKELFGEGKHAGAFERAQGGTLLLDELEELSLELQQRLLRVVEQREVKRLGEREARALDVRIVAASQRELSAQVAAKRFREDLYHRLAVVRIRLPPLRERLEDLPFLVEDLLAGMGKDREAVGPKMMQVLRGYTWPGNVRELRNVVERTLSLGEAELPAGEPAPPHAGAKKAERSPGADPKVPFKEAKDDLVTAFEREYVVKLLADHNGNVSSAARAAKVTRAYLQRLMSKHGLRA